VPVLVPCKHLKKLFDLYNLLLLKVVPLGNAVPDRGCFQMDGLDCAPQVGFQ
jgi:hypothetical protein